MLEFKLCIWKEDKEGGWFTKCGHHFLKSEGTPKENGFKFCPCCGRMLRQINYKGR